MTLPLITNIMFAALVLVAIPGLLAWAIRTSRNDGWSPHARRTPAHAASELPVAPPQPLAHVAAASHSGRSAAVTVS